MCSRHKPFLYLQADRCSKVAATAILIFDYLITFNSELTLIWPTPLTYTKVLFLLTRYLPFIEIVVILFSKPLFYLCAKNLTG